MPKQNIGIILMFSKYFHSNSETWENESNADSRTLVQINYWFAVEIIVNFEGATIIVLNI